MQQPNRHLEKIASLSLIYPGIFSLLILIAIAPVFAHGGHGDEFKNSSQTTTNVQVNVDRETAQRLGVKTVVVKKQTLALGIKTTGQIETLPSQKVEVTTPIPGAKVVELLVEPGATVSKGQPVAVVTSPDLVTLRVESQEKRVAAIAELQQAQTDLQLAEQNYRRYLQIADAEIKQAQSQVSFARDKYDKDRQLAIEGALPRRNALESQTQLAEAQAKYTTVNSKRDVIAAEAQVQRARSALQVAKERLRLSDTTYQTRLRQIGNLPNNKGLVTVNAPISGKIADREVTIGQTFNDAGGKLMTIVDDSRVFATANIYEKDLARVKIGQQVKLQVANSRDFSGKISRIGTSVEGETRVVPVQAAIANFGGDLKPGMFAELEVLTGQQSLPTLVVPASAIVDSNGQKLVYIQNGNAYQAAEVTLGQTNGDMVEVKTGLFEGDIIVTQRATQLFAESLRGKSKQADNHEYGEETQAKINHLSIPMGLLAFAGGMVIAVSAFAAGNFWSYRRRGLVRDNFDARKEVYLDDRRKSDFLSASVGEKGENQE